MGTYKQTILGLTFIALFVGQSLPAFAQYQTEIPLPLPPIPHRTAPQPNPLQLDGTSEDQPAMPQNSNSLNNLNSDEVLVPIDQTIIQKHRNFKGVVLIAHGPAILFEQAYGSVPSSGKPYDADTRFLLASITKQFTAALILKEYERGHIGLDTSVRRYIPGTPLSWEPVTIRKLLNHTSGFRYDYLNVHTFSSQAQVLTFIKKMKPRYPKNASDFFYNNVNYFLLGTVLEIVTGIPLSELVRKEITEPLNMTRSGMIPPWSARASQLYSSEMEPQAANPANYFAVGNMYSSLEDLYKWERALLVDGVVLDPTTVKKMITPPGFDPDFVNRIYPTGNYLQTVSYHLKNISNTKKSFQSGYGFGLRVAAMNDEIVAHHTGHLVGHTTLLIHYMGHDITIIILTNESNYPVFTMANDIINTVFGVPTVPTKRNKRLRTAKRTHTATHKHS